VTRVRVEDNTPKRKDGRTVDLMLDSGAFSAWNQGDTIDLKGYIRYLKENYRYLFSYVNLDVLAPGEERYRTHAEVEKAANQSYANQVKMKEAGLKPIPVYHQGESLYHLERMLKDGEQYIGISCRKDLMAAEQCKWLDSVFSFMSDADGKPLVKTHGFGITRPGFLFRYPWYTVDSTTWSLSPGYGQIIVPVYDSEGAPDLTRPPQRCVISGVMHKTVSSQKKQFEAMGERQQEAVRRWLEDEVGISITEARYGTNMRRRAVLIYYIMLCKALRDIRYIGPRATIFGKDHFDIRKLKATEPFNLSVFYATSLSREWSALMNDVGARTRLLSYYELKDRDNEVLQTYVLTGSNGEYVPSAIKRDWKEAYRNRRRLALYYRIQRYKQDEEGEGQQASSRPGPEGEGRFRSRVPKKARAARGKKNDRVRP
jgi:hypothetical protein